MISRIFEKQWLHLLLLTALLFGVTFLPEIPGFQTGSFWLFDTIDWFWIAVALAIIHQTFVWLCWRLELHASLLTKILGKTGFSAYALLFSILAVARVLAVVFLAISNQKTASESDILFKLLAVIAAIPASYLIYSVQRYFGFRRAFGIDHFDSTYSSRPFVREGIFRYTRNAMYTFGLLILWIPALWWASLAAICAALFNHLYIWVHYFSTELPDIRRIYGKHREAEPSD